MRTVSRSSNILCVTCHEHGPARRSRSTTINSSHVTMNHHPCTPRLVRGGERHGRNVVRKSRLLIGVGLSVPDVSAQAIANLEVETLQHKFPRSTRHHPCGNPCARSQRKVETVAHRDVESKGFIARQSCYFVVASWVKRDASSRRALHGTTLGRLTATECFAPTEGLFALTPQPPVSVAGDGELRDFHGVGSRSLGGPVSS